MDNLTNSKPWDTSMAYVSPSKTRAVIFINGKWTMFYQLDVFNRKYKEDYSAVWIVVVNGIEYFSLKIAQDERTNKITAGNRDRDKERPDQSGNNASAII